MRDPAMFLFLLSPPILIAAGVLVAEVIQRRGRFSIKTLLIAITVVAVAFGLAIFMSN